MGDLEHGTWAGNSSGTNPDNAPILGATVVTAMLRGQPGRFTLKGGDARVYNALRTQYDGPYPRGYSPMRKQGGVSSCPTCQYGCVYR
eukprot:COSAG05_NODE_264_length_12674_cov_6.768111_4_plen_88_part_00